MKAFLAVATSAALLLAASVGSAQKSRSAGAKPGTGAAAGAGASAKVVSTFLGASPYSGGAIPKSVFDSLAAQGLRATDEAGTSLSVRGFDFGFAERGFYEDSVGNPIVVVDQIHERCLGDTLPPYIAYTLPERTRAGDTIRFERVRVAMPDGREGTGKAMLFILTK